jgi:rod shape-determining protein MreD
MTAAPLTGLARSALVVVAAVVAVLLGHRTTLPLPDLVLPLVAAAALLGGPVRGALWGLAAGWVVDVVPPGSPVLGTSALLYAACGLLAGAGRREGATPWGWVAVVGVGAAVTAGVGRLALGVLGGEPFDPLARAQDLALSALWCALTVPLLVAGEQWWRRRTA